MRTVQSYIKAILLTVPRSGSEVLVECLDSHPDILCESELLLEHMNNFDYGEKVMRNFFESPLNEKDIRKIPKRAICFKAMYMHLGEKSWKYIRDNNVKIIHLIRNNQFERAISDEFNNRKGETHRQAHTREEENVISLKIEREKLMSSIDEYNKMILDTSKKLNEGNYDFMTIHYEEMFRNRLFNKTKIDVLPRRITKRICSFLEIPYRPMSTTLVKQNNKHLKEYVSNWDEIKDLVNRKNE